MSACAPTGTLPKEMRDVQLSGECAEGRQPAPWMERRWKKGADWRMAHTVKFVYVRIDSLFASVEQVRNARLRGKAVIVGRDTVLSASYEAEGRGVENGMSVAKARRICPKAVVVAGDFGETARIVERVRQTVEKYASVVEACGADEFCLRVTGTDWALNRCENTLRRMQAEVLRRTGLSVSVGAARTKTIAAVAARAVRPRGLRAVATGKEDELLAAMPVNELEGLDQARAESLRQSGILTLGQLRRVPKLSLVAVLGEEQGRRIWTLVRRPDPDGSSHKVPLLWMERACKIEGSLNHKIVLENTLEFLTARIAAALEDGGSKAQSLALQVQFADQSWARQQVRFTRATRDLQELQAKSEELFEELCRDAKVAATISIAVRRVQNVLPDQGKTNTQSTWQHVWTRVLVWAGFGVRRSSSNKSEGRYAEV